MEQQLFLAENQFNCFYFSPSLEQKAVMIAIFNTGVQASDFDSDSQVLFLN